MSGRTHTSWPTPNRAAWFPILRPPRLLDLELAQPDSSLRRHALGPWGRRQFLPDLSGVACLAGRHRRPRLPRRVERARAVEPRLIGSLLIGLSGVVRLV